MKVIGAGLPRTATTTQKLSLEMLGLGPCYHKRDLMENFDEHLPPWDLSGGGVTSVQQWWDRGQAAVA
jgi:hypothetical protein